MNLPNMSRKYVHIGLRSLSWFSCYEEESNVNHNDNVNRELGR